MSKFRMLMIKNELSIESFSHPTAKIFKGTKRHSLQATVCGECGYTQLNTENPKELWDNYSKK